MIEGFEDYTDELTDEEKKILEVLVVGLKEYRGRKRAISNSQICTKLNDWFPINTWGISKTYVLTPVRVRMMVHIIRHSNLLPLLLSSSNGYYIAATKSEVMSTLNSLKQRIGSIQEIHDALEKQYMANKDSLINDEVEDGN